MPIMSRKEPVGCWRGPSYDNIALDGETCERVHRGIASGLRIRSIGRHTVMEDPSKRAGELRAYISESEFAEL